MFWKTQAVELSSINDTLSKPDVTLDEILDDEFVLQELKANNRTLLDFITKEEMLLTMLKYSLEEPGGDTEDIKRFKKAHVSSEILTSNVDEVNNGLVGSDQIIGIMSAFLDQKTLNPVLASFYTKIFTQILAKHPNDGCALRLMQRSGRFVSSLCGHLETSAVMDLCYRLVTVPEDEIDCLKIKNWLVSEGFVAKLTECFSAGQEPDTPAYAGNLWAELVRILRDLQYSREDKNFDPMLEALQSEKSLSGLLDAMLSPESRKSDVILESGCAVFHALLSSVYVPRNPAELAEKASGSHAPREMEGEGAIWTPDPHHITESCIAARLTDFHQILEHSSLCREVSTSLGVVRGLGRGRLGVVKLLSLLLNTNQPCIHLQLHRLGTIQVLLNLFFAFPWNNFLQTAISLCVTYVVFSGRPFEQNDNLEQGSKELISNNRSDGDEEPHLALIKQLINDVNILEIILDKFEDKPPNDSQAASYAGHVMKMARMIYYASLRGPNKTFLKGLLNARSDLEERWEGFVEYIMVPYEKANEPDPVEAPSMSLFGVFSHPEAEFAPESKTIGEELNQMQTISEPLPDQFGLPMDTFSGENEDPIDSLAEKSTIQLDFSLEDYKKTIPPGEADFDALCSAKINTFSLEDKEEARKESEGAKDMEIDDPWKDSSTSVGVGWADFSESRGFADFGSAFGGSPPGTWSESSPVSQGIAVATSLGSHWAQCDFSSSPPKFGSPPKNSSLSPGKRSLSPANKS